jgi:CRISPR-associated protein Cas1
VLTLLENDNSLIDSLIPVRMLNELVYCPRLFYYEYVEKEFTENQDTLDGHFVHRRVDQEERERQRVGETEVWTYKSLYLSAPRLHLIAKIDIVEEAGGEAVPVEYKRGEAPKIPGDAWDSDKVQVCAQGLVLRENGYRCTHGEIYYATSRRRVMVKITDELVKKTLAVIDEALALAHSNTLPPPLVDSPKCPRCSLVGICLPDETNLLVPHSSANDDVEVRRMFPAKSDALPVYVQEQGTNVGRSGDNLILSSPSGKKERLRLIDVSQLCLFGNVHLTPSALRLLVENGIPICYFTYGGWFYAITLGHPHKNVELRVAQYKSADDSAKALRLASKFVEGKIQNMRTMLRRNHPNAVVYALRRLSGIARLSEIATNMESLLGYEGTATEIYFSNFQGMLKGLIRDVFHFSERNRRPPLDRVNALLSFVYALLVKDCFSSIISVGLDPYLGFLHRPRYGRPALALDLMEEFRPIIGDSVVISLINNRELDGNDFAQHGKAVALNQKGRRKVIEAYHRRLDTLVTHHLFGYKLSYARVLEVQARLLCRALIGEIPEYIPFVTR